MLEAVEDRLMLGPDLILAALLLLALPVEFGEVLAELAAGDGGSAIIVDVLAVAVQEGDGQRVRPAVLDPHQLAALVDRHERAAQRPLQRIGADPLDPFVDRPVPGFGEAVGPGRIEQQIGAARAHADGARRASDAAAARQGEDERPLPPLRPAAPPRALSRDGGEGDVLG